MHPLLAPVPAVASAQLRASCPGMSFIPVTLWAHRWREVLLAALQQLAPTRHALERGDLENLWGEVQAEAVHTLVCLTEVLPARLAQYSGRGNLGACDCSHRTCHAACAIGNCRRRCSHHQAHVRRG